MSESTRTQERLDEAKPRSVVAQLSPALARLVLALHRAKNNDAGIVPLARGWRSPQQLADAVADQDPHLIPVEPQTVRAYISKVNRLIREAAAAAGVGDVPKLFEQRRSMGVRLATDLTVVLGGNNPGGPRCTDPPQRPGQEQSAVLYLPGGPDSGGFLILGDGAKW